MTRETTTYEEIIRAVNDQEAASWLTLLNGQYQVDEHINRLRELYRGKGLTLALGAGVSKSCGAPSWQELLLTLHQRQLQTIGEHDLSALTNVYVQAVSEDGPLIAARMAVGHLADKDGEALRELVRSSLYGKPRQSSPLLKALARLAMCAEGRTGVLSVLTYNYDVLLEVEFDEICRPYRLLDKRDLGEGDGIPIRHVHGFLRTEKDPKEWVVLTEGEYHAEYANPLSWSTIVQINAFRENACVFVGLSMSDPNLRRLLEGGRQTAAPEHFAFLAKSSPKRLQELLEAKWSTRGFAMGAPTIAQKKQVEDRLALVSALADSNRATALKALGVQVIYYESHDQLPSLIDSIRQTPQTRGRQ